MRQLMIDFDSQQQTEEQTKVTTDASLPPPPELLRPDRQIIYPSAYSHYDWPPAETLHDRNTITVDRVSAPTTATPDHRFVIKRGDTVSVHYSANRNEIGLVTGISHANNEVRVSHLEGKQGVWHSVGTIYPAAVPPAVAEHPTFAMSEAVAHKNEQNAPADGFSKEDQVLEPYSFEEFKELWKKGFAHPSFEEYRATFERIVASKKELIAGLKTTYKAPKLKAIATRMGTLHARTNTKDQSAQCIYQSMLGTFSLDAVTSYGMNETYEEAIAKKVLSVTKEEWETYQAEKLAKKSQHEKALSDPQSFSDYRLVVREKGEDALSDEQLARYDKLYADITREQRASKRETTVSQFESSEVAEAGFTIKQGYHEKKDCPLWIVQLESRVGKASFGELKSKAKMLGGWWSSFKKADAGFQFVTEEAAKKFTELLSGDADRSEELADKKSYREQTASERLHGLADEMLRRSEETIERSKESLQNTARRASIQAGVRGAAHKEAAVARSLHSVAVALSTGDATYLDGVRHRTHLEVLDRTLHLAKWARIRSLQKKDREGELGYNLRLDEEQDKPLSAGDIRHAEYPYPSIYLRHLREALATASDKPGIKQVAKKLSKRIGSYDDSSEYLPFRNDSGIELLLDFTTRCKAAGVPSEPLTDATIHYRRMQAAGLKNLHELRAALREYLPHKATARGDDPVQIAERELIGKDLPGFFPTPAPIIEQMLEYAQLEASHAVLEPSAGKGDIVSAIEAEVPGISITAIERNHALAEVLSAKGIQAQFGDFLEHTGRYDRVVMNPPFEKGQDIAHIEHAYRLLEPSGKLVAIASEGAFLRADRKAVAFQNWITDVEAFSIKLPENAFNTREAFRQTGVRTRMLVVEKSKTESA